MVVKYTKPFNKDVLNINNRKLALGVNSVIEEIELASNISQLRNLKKLKGYTNHYRIRISDFRIGIIIISNEVWLARLMHRKDIYKYFP